MLDHLPEHDRATVGGGCAAAWALDDHDARSSGCELADELARTDPGAAASLREGIEETLTVTRLGVPGQLKRTLASTNPCESMIETVRRTSRNVKRWQNGDMCLRWTAAGMLEAEHQFRKIIGHSARSPALRPACARPWLLRVSRFGAQSAAPEHHWYPLQPS